MAEPTSPPHSVPPPEEPLPPSASLAPSPSLGEDWPRQATDAVVKVVDAVRDKTTGPAVNAAHALKYGIVVALVAAVLGVLALVMLIRGSEAFLILVGDWFNWTWLTDPIWLVYLFYGSVFSLLGLRFWQKANRPAKAGAR